MIWYDLLWLCHHFSMHMWRTLVESWPMKTPTILCLCFVLRTLKVWVSVENWCVLWTNGQMTLSLTCGWRLRAPETWRSTNALATRPWNSSPWNAKTIRKFMMKNLAWWGWQGHPPNEQNVGKDGRFLPGMALFCVQQTTTKIPWDTFRVTVDLGGTWGFPGSFIFGLAFFGGFFFGSSPIGSRGELPERHSIAGLKSLQLTFDQAAIPWRDGDWWLHLADKNGSERMDADEEETRINLSVSCGFIAVLLILIVAWEESLPKPPRSHSPLWFPTVDRTNRNTRHCNDIRPSLKRPYLRVRRAVWKPDVDLTKMKRMMRFEQFYIFPIFLADAFFSQPWPKKGAHDTCTCHDTYFIS